MRACVMSGTYTPRHHIYTPGGKSKGKTEYMRLLVPAVSRKDKALDKQAAAQFPITNSLDPDFVCIPEILGPVGYRTARLGKWHLGDDTQGFDLSSANGKGGPGGSFYGNVDVAQQLTDPAVQFIDENRDGPFFLYLCHWDVHVPHRARKDVVSKYQAKLDGIAKGQRQNFNPIYAAMIEAVDRSVGRVADKVDELGLSEKTLIVFISDNGGLPNVSQLDPLRARKGRSLKLVFGFPPAFDGRVRSSRIRVAIRRSPASIFYPPLRSSPAASFPRRSPLTERTFRRCLWARKSASGAFSGITRFICRDEA